VSISQAVTFERVGTRWLVADWQAPDPGIPVVPWDGVDRAVALTRPHVLVFGDVANGRRNERLATRLEAAVKDVREMWPGPGWDGKIVVYAITDSEFLAPIFGPGSADPGGPSPFYWRAQSAYSGDAPAGRGVVRVAFGAGYTTYDDPWTRRELRYALTYGALIDDGGAYVPAWMRHGVGLYASTRTGGGAVDALAALDARPPSDPTLARIRRGGWLPSLPLVGFAAGSDARTEAELDSAWFGWLYVADTFGEAKVRALWQAATAGNGYLDDTAQMALASALDMSKATFEKNVAAYARRLVARSR
jgi:hypothetical protein